MLFAGTCALGQDDIKRVLAYSTVSQLGFMFMAAGLRAYSVAIFMLVAHAFYKALMFLGAGSVMHGMHEETDMKVMGGLLRRMPLTAITFASARWRSRACRPFAGFFAKDEILEIAQSNSEWGYYVLGTLGGVHLGALHRPAGLPDVLRHGPQRSGRARARVSPGDVGSRSSCSPSAP